MPDTQRIPDAVLDVVAPDGSRRSVRITQSPFLIGRGEEAGNHLHLSDKRVSRRCAALLYAEGVYRLEDRGQRHGVFVNGEKIDVRPLRDRDTITFGAGASYQLIFHTGRPDEPLPQLLSRLERASALEPGARDLRHLSLLLEATALLHSPRPLEDVLGAMVDRALTITDADRGLLLEADPATGLRPLLARQRGSGELSAESLQPSRTAIAQALEQRRSVMEYDVAHAGPLREAHSIVAQQLRSVIAIPLHSLSAFRSSDTTYVSTPGDLLGMLYLDSRRPAAFSRLERQILDALAREAASVLDNARLLQKEHQRRRLEHEVAIAREIQQTLLPRSFQHFPHLQVTGINHPCLAVGGDYFDLIQLSPDRTAFVIADVCGKGLGAALLTAMLQGTFFAMTLGQEPASVFTHVNHFICARSKMERYATLFFGILDSGGRLEFINAGHPPPLRVHAGRVEPVFPAESLPLGLMPEAEFATASATLDPGDTLVLFTDGINEAVDPQDEEFGLERLRAVVARHATAGVEELQAAILNAVGEYTRGAPQADDLTLLILHYRGAA
ncbi:MAG: SpoIIE family protein phosphatase [Terriglobia bacterium]